MLYKNRNRAIEKFLGEIFSFMKPNHISLFSIIISIVGFYFILQENFLHVAVVLFLMGFLDVVDGSVARFTKSASKKGAYIDTIADRYSEFIIIFGLVFISLPNIFFPSQIWIFLFLFGSMMTTYAKASASEKLSSKTSGGFLERAERIIFLFAGFVLAFYDKNYLMHIIIILAILSNLTALQRILRALK